MRPLGRLLLLFSVTIADASLLAAQTKTATYAGLVLGDFSGEPVADVAIAFPALRRSTSTDSVGQFSFTEVRPGTYEVAVRRVGYQPVNRRLVLQAGQTLVDTIRVTRVAVLETVSVSAGIIRSFEENRAIGLGKFLDRDQLSKMGSRRTSDVISEVSRSAVLNGRGNSSWLIGRRGTTSLNPKSISKGNSSNEGLDPGDKSMGAQQGYCYAQVYLDKTLVYRNSGRGQEPLFNLNSVNLDQVEAIEYYAGPAQTPLEYSTLNSNCGVLVIHTRRPRERSQ